MFGNGGEIVLRQQLLFISNAEDFFACLAPTLSLVPSLRLIK